jgi:hypothetical protein
MFHKIEVEVGYFCLNKDTGVTGLISAAFFTSFFIIKVSKICRVFKIFAFQFHFFRKRALLQLFTILFF